MMTDTEARALIVEALNKTARSFNNPAVSDRLQTPGADLALAELELDSLDMVEWSVEIEKDCGVSIDTADLAAAANLSDVVAAVVRKAAEAA